MKFSYDELKLITALAIAGSDGSPVVINRLADLFDRPCKLRRAVKALECHQFITHDPYQGVARLLVQPTLQALISGPTATETELFTDERPLDKALAESSNTRAGTFAAPAPCSSNTVRVPEHAVRVPEHKSPPDPYNVVTFNRKNVLTSKRTTLTLEQLQEQVMQFVGPDDFALYWEKQNFWADEQRCGLLERAMRYLRAGIKAQEIKTRTTPGRHLWNQFRHDCRAKGIEAMI